MGVGSAALILLLSAAGSGMSATGETNLDGIIKRAAQIGDYQTAREIYEARLRNVKPDVLGVESDQVSAETSLEELVYPERKVQRRIVDLEVKLEIYPENKEIYLLLADLYGQLDEKDKASEYREKARVLDPNGAEFR